MYQSIVPPRAELNDWLFIQFSGPEVIDGLRLPSEWVLEDWPTGFVAIGARGILDGITAQIYDITPIASGDYDRDGVVDAADYAHWRVNYGGNAASGADGNRDGVVDAADYTVWRDNLGSVASATAVGNQTVPEPGGAAMLSMMLMFQVLVFGATRARATRYRRA